MLTRSPPLPLIIGFEDENHGLTAEDEEGIMLALQHRNRVRRIYFRMPVPSLQKLIKAMDGGFPTLELLQIGPPVKPNTYLTLPSTFEAPQLRHLILDYFNSPIGSPFLTSAVGLVTLLCRIHPSTYFHPNRLLQTLSLLPQLERLEIGFLSPIPNRERQLLHTPITTQVTLPNLRRLSFRGISAYFDAFLPHMTTPLLESLSVYFFNQLSFYIPGILQFMSTTENLNFTLARLLFYHEAATVFLYSRVGTRLLNFYFEVICRHFDWQVFSVAQVFNTLRPLFSSVVDLMLDYTEHSLSPEWHNDVDPTQWRELLGAFRNVRTLHFHSGLIFWTFRALRWDGKPLLEPLPRLELLNDAGKHTSLYNTAVTAHRFVCNRRFCPTSRISSDNIQILFGF
jgi:hypothetical protein